MTHTYTINSTTVPNGGTVTLNTGSGYTIGTGATTVGPIYTTTGTGTATWSTPNTQFNGGNGKPVMSMPHGTDEVILEKDATLTVKGRVVINDRDLEERLSTMEKLLQIPERDVKLESKHPKLKKLYDEYIHALAKYRTFEAIKGDE
jgi:hypothetical protein